MRTALLTAVFAISEAGQALGDHLGHHHDHDEALLTHHWSMPSYTHEIRLQLAIIAAALAAAGLWSAVSSIRRKKKCEG